VKVANVGAIMGRPTRQTDERSEQCKLSIRWKLLFLPNRICRWRPRSELQGIRSRWDGQDRLDRWCCLCISPSYFQLHFPEENAELVQRSAERRRIAREHRDAVLRKEIFEIVRELREKNIYPSVPRVRSALSPGLPRSSLLLWPITNEARSQFGAAIRPRNELGQFV